MLAINLVSEMRFSPLIIYFQAARRELERQRQMEWERQRKEQLLSEKAREYEQLGTIKSRASNLKCELESQVGQPLSYKYFIFNFVVIYESLYVTFTCIKFIVFFVSFLILVYAHIIVV